jgi:hypothetical protein
MKIAIIVPTRERVNRSVTLLFSIISTVKDINNVNVYFGLDEDDPTRDVMIKIAAAIPCVKIINIKNNGQFLGLGKLWNICVEKTQEEIISMIGDDMVFKTPNWDIEIINEFTKLCPDDKIKAVHCNDGYHGPNLAVNLFCHRKYTEIMGHFMREEFKVNWVDRWLHQMFSAFNRLKYRNDIMIEHRHWVFGKNPKDKTANRMGEADKGKISDNLWNGLVNERVNDVKKLSNYLNIQPNWRVVETEGAINL